MGTPKSLRGEPIPEHWGFFPLGLEKTEEPLVESSSFQSPASTTRNSCVFWILIQRGWGHVKDVI